MVRVPIIINVVGSSLTERMLVGAFSCIQKLNSGKRKSMRHLRSYIIDEQCTTVLNPTRDKKRHVPGGTGNDTGEHCLSKRSLRVKPSTSLAESESDDLKKMLLNRKLKVKII